MTTSTDRTMSANAEPTLSQTQPHPIDALRAARALARTNETTNWDPQEADFPAWSNSRTLVRHHAKSSGGLPGRTTHPIVPPRSLTQASFPLHFTPSRKLTSTNIRSISTDIPRTKSGALSNRSSAWFQPTNTSFRSKPKTLSQHD